MDDEQLRQLIANLAKYPNKSQEFDRAINRLLIYVQSLPEFTKFCHPGCPEYLLDALNRTWEWLSREIRNFEPQSNSIRTDLVKWINSYLKWRIKDAINAEFSHRMLHSLDDKTTYTDLAFDPKTYLEQIAQSGYIPGTRANPRVLTGIESYLEQMQSQSRQNLSLELKSYIELDPDKKLRSCYPRHRPDCNCQLFTIRQYLKEPPDKLAALSREYNINYQTLVWHWKQKAIPLLQTIAIELGYQSSEP